jgi:predicted HTH domain antitoxin
MQLIMDLPDNLPDVLHISKEQFLEEAKLALFLKLYELKRISSGVAARALGIPRIEFLFLLKQYKIPVIDQDEEELKQDILNA